MNLTSKTNELFTVENPDKNSDHRQNEKKTLFFSKKLLKYYCLYSNKILSMVIKSFKQGNYFKFYALVLYGIAQLY